MNKAILRYLPLFRDDLLSAINYIRDTLQNEKAANDLVDEVERAIISRSENPEIFEKYRSLRDRKYPYYRIYVRNYVVYYVVIPENPPIMEVRRFLYNRRNRSMIV